MVKKILLAAALSTQLTLSGFAQQPSTSNVGTPPPTQQPNQKPDEADVVRITTNLVQVDAVVTDNHGKVVKDLKPDEVEIFEDGRKQKITHFNFTAAETPAATAAKPAATDKTAPPVPTVLRREDVKRTIAIVVDDLGLSFESVVFVRHALKKFVEEQMQPGDLVAIIRSSGGMGALQQFTGDKRQLAAAVERIKWNAMGRSGVSAFAPMEPGPFSGAAADASKAANTELDELREEVFSVGTLGALSYVIRGLHELPGRKSILLISDGFRLTQTSLPVNSNRGAEVATMDRTMRGVEALIDQANRASVVIYTMNATGLQTLSLSAADNTSGQSAGEIDQALSDRRLEAFDKDSGLDYLAKNTGGLAIHNTNDLSGGIKRIIQDQAGYYLIGYRPDESTFDPKTGRRKFHHLTLKVTRPGKFNVRMRNGFFGVTEEARQPPQTLAQKLTAALVSPFGETGVHLQLTSLFANDAKAGSFMRSVLHIDAHDLTFTEEPNKIYKSVFDVLSMTFGDNGVPIEQTGRTYAVHLPEELYKRAQRDGLVYYVTVPVKKPGAYQLRMSLRDSSSDRIGSASQFVEVPDLKKNRLAVSGIALKGDAPNTRPAADAPAADQEGIDKGNAEASPAVRHFHNGMTMTYAFYVYNAHSYKGAPPQLVSQVILFRDGKPVFTGKQNAMNVTGQTDFKRLAGAGAIILGNDLTPGDYVLQVLITDTLADKKHQLATQTMDFTIVK